MVAYWLLTEKRPTKGYVLYVDTQKSAWSLLCPLDYGSAGIQDIAKQIEGYLSYLMSARLASDCVPRLGSHCSEEFCPYRARCKDVYVPPPGDIDETKDRLPSIILQGL
jgi:hypothetical protein